MATGGLSHQVHGERAGFLNEEWDAEFLELLEKQPETLANMRIAEFAEKGGFEGAEVVMWLIMRGALSDQVKLIHKQNYAPSVTNIATLVFEDLGDVPNPEDIEAYREHLDYELQGVEKLAGTYPFTHAVSHANFRINSFLRDLVIPQHRMRFVKDFEALANERGLTEEEKKKIKKMVIERVNGRIPILLGVGGNNTRAIVETLKNDDFTGVDAILSVVPYYNKPSQEGIYQHYKAISEATDLPIVLYNVPGRTGVNMKAETTLRIARDFKNVIAVKEASGDITQMDDIIKNKPANFDVISGDDGITFPLITLGAVGIISVIGNAFPREFSRMVRLALQGDYANALTIHHKFAELFKLLFVDGNPAGVKAMLNVMGMIENKLRLPLVPTRITTFEAMRKILDELNIKC